MNKIPAGLAGVLRLAGELRGLAGEAEGLGRLHPDQLDLLYEQGWFKLFVPRSYGGLELSLPEGLRIEEGLARVDGSLGWTVTLCSGANWFVGFLRPELAEVLFADRRVCLAGSGRPDGVARIVGGKRERGVGSEGVGGGYAAGGEAEVDDAAGEEVGSGEEGSEGRVIYEVTGSWKYATGAPHATAFTANCRIEKEGVLLENADGSPVVRAFVFLNPEVAVREDWEVMGMIATASHSFSVEGLRVGEERCFRIDGRHAFLPQAIYRYPFQALAEATLAVNHAGMAARFIELCGEGEGVRGEVTGEGVREEVTGEGVREEVTGDEVMGEEAMGEEEGRWKAEVREAEARETERRNRMVREAGLRLEELRKVFYGVVEDSWEECVRGGEPSPELLTAVGAESRRLARESRRLVAELYPYCGLKAAQPGTEINRIWRDLHTASQHPLLREGA